MINNTKTIFSSIFGLPSAIYSFLKSLMCKFFQLLLGLYIKCNKSQAAPNKRTVAGIAKINQSANEISGISGKIILTILANERLGGVPTNVEIPPIDAEYAMPKSKPMEYFPIFACPILSSSFKIIDNAM